MSYLLVNDWEEHQTYRRDRKPPPWIKIHRRIFMSGKWAHLSDAEKGQLVSLWILAADQSGKIPSDPAILKKLALLDHEPNINKFKELGLLASSGRQCGVNVASTGCHTDAPEAKAKAKAKADKTLCAKKFARLGDWKNDDNFLALKMKYPARAGNSPKAAYKAYRARIRQGHTWKTINAGLDRYLAYCEHQRLIGTNKVKQLQTFFGPDEHFLNDWKLPAQKRSRTQDSSAKGREAIMAMGGYDDLPF